SRGIAATDPSIPERGGRHSGDVGCACAPALRARLLANDAQAFIALTQKRLESPGLEAVLPTMQMPCFLYVGEADGAYAGMKECLPPMPNATLVSFLGLNHVETLFHPELVVPEVLKFLQAVCKDT